MTSAVQIDDLRLVLTLEQTGSLGSAARLLLISQPSASHRLAALERRLGVPLFHRSPRGTVATAAGRDLAAQAGAILAQVEAIPERTLAAAHAATLGFGSIASIAGIVFAGLDATVGDIVVQPAIDHGPALLARVRERALDGAVVAIAGQAASSRGLRIVELLRMRMVVVVPQHADRPGGGRRPFDDVDVVFAIPDRSGEVIHGQLAALGARPRAAATGEAAIRIARQRACPAVVPDLVARWVASAVEQVVPAPIARTTTLSLVAPASAPPEALDVIKFGDELRERLLTGP